jgi:hypothetical protein
VQAATHNYRINPTDRRAVARGLVVVHRLRAARGLCGALGRQGQNMTHAPAEVLTLSLEGDSIRLHTSGQLVWEVPVDEVRVIGEYTNQSGPWGDDWFVLFVGRDGNWFEVPTDVATLTSVLRDLSDRLHTPITLGLANSASFRSSILWPPSLSGQQLLSFRPMRLRNWLLRAFAPRRVEFTLTKVVLDALS